MSIKDSLGESKKFLLLAFALLIVCILIVVMLKSGIYSPTNLLTTRETYGGASYVLEEEFNYSIVVSTIYGDINIDLYEDAAPENVNSLLFLMGNRYYDGLTFYKVIKDFVIQTGDAKGDGTGDPGYSVKKENLVDFKDYDVGMANASQFFIVLQGSSKESFNGNYSVVGRVTEGFAVLDSIEKAEVDKNYKPINDIIIKSIQINED